MIGILRLICSRDKDQVESTNQLSLKARKRTKIITFFFSFLIAEKDRFVERRKSMRIKISQDINYATENVDCI